MKIFVFLFLVLFCLSSNGNNIPKLIEQFGINSCTKQLVQNGKLYPKLQAEDHIFYQDKLWKLWEDNPTLARGMEQELKSLLKDSKVYNEGLIGVGASNPVLLELDQKVLGVFKKDGSSNFHNTASEVGAYKLDRLFGFNLVPVTVERIYKGERGSLQLFVHQSKTFNDVLFTQKRISKSIDQDRQKIRLFDFLIGNRDRGNLNMIIQNNRMRAIDNGHSIVHRVAAFRDIENVDLAYFKTKEGKELLENLKAVDNEVLFQVLRPYGDDLALDGIISAREELVFHAERYLRRH